MSCGESSFRSGFMWSSPMRLATSVFSNWRRRCLHLSFSSSGIIDKIQTSEINSSFRFKVCQLSALIWSFISNYMVMALVFFKVVNGYIEMWFIFECSRPFESYTQAPILVIIRRIRSWFAIASTSYISFINKTCRKLHFKKAKIENKIEIVDVSWKKQQWERTQTWL